MLSFLKRKAFGIQPPEFSVNPLLKYFGSRKGGRKVLIGIEKMGRESSLHLGHGLFRGLPYIDGRVGVALPAKDHRITVAASVAPDIENPAFFTQGLGAAVADDHGLVFPAKLANPAFGDFDHDRLLQISLVIPSRTRRWS